MNVKHDTIVRLNYTPTTTNPNKLLVAGLFKYDMTGYLFSDSSLCKDSNRDIDNHKNIFYHNDHTNVFYCTVQNKDVDNSLRMDICDAL